MNLAIWHWVCCSQGRIMGVRAVETGGKGSFLLRYRDGQKRPSRQEQKGSSRMLVLSRKKNEAIRIGDGVEVVVAQIRGNSVRLAISAPPSVPILRKELVEPIRKETDSPAENETLPRQPCC